MSAYQRRHFVSQFYLRGFASGNNLSRIGVGIIEPFKIIQTASVGTQAQSLKFYPDDTEDLMKRLETLWGVSFARMLKSRRVPVQSSEDWWRILEYVVVQAFRTEQAVADHENADRQVLELLAREIASATNFSGKFRVTNRASVNSLLKLAGETVDLAADLSAKLLAAPEPCGFITSDHPVIMYNQFQEQQRLLGGTTGWAARGLQVFIPLSPALCLMLYDPLVYRVGFRKLAGSPVEISAADVGQLNLLQAANARQVVLFRSGMPGFIVKSIVDRARPIRQEVRSRLNLARIRPAADGSTRQLIHLQKLDLNIRLNLSRVEVLPSASRLRDDRGANRYRDWPRYVSAELRRKRSDGDSHPGSA